MKVTLINTNDMGGGAPIACIRLAKALVSKGIEVIVQVQEKKTASPLIKGLGDGLLQKLKNKYNFLAERLPFIWLYAKDKSLRFAFSTANTGTDISRKNEIVNADVLHLHWTNRGYLSIDNIENLFETGKPVVWTLHDMWAFTGGCHYTGECDNFKSNCGNCWMLKNPASADISFAGLLAKKAMYEHAKNILFVTCSNWLADMARQSSLLKDFRIEAIPNPIDTNVFSAKDKIVTRLKWGIKPTSKIILFGAANILDRRKGISYLVDALKVLIDNYAETAQIEIVIFGKNKSFDVTSLPFYVYELSTINSENDLAELYSLADVFVSPAIEDNLPNTIMEALACGTPVVAFNTGGIPDLVDHQQNGYLAEFKSVVDFAAGINFVLNSGKAETLAKNAREKVLNTFTNDIVAAKYINVYQSILN